MKHVAVIGGGFSGLSAAVRLVQAGLRVTLFERRKHLGGRAYSFTDPTTGDTIDNGQHLFMKGYTATRDFLARIGTADRLYFQDPFQIDFRHPRKGPSRLAFPRRLPPPLHLLAGFLQFRPVGPGDVFRLRHIARSLKVPDNPHLSVEAWLDACRQSPEIRQAFWNPLCISALNEPPQSAPAHHLKAVLREAFFGGPAQLGYPQVGLSALYTQAARQLIERHNGQVRLPIAVTGIEPLQDKIQIHLKSHPTVTADACIAAVPPPALARLLSPKFFGALARVLPQFRPSPILSVNLWLDTPVLNAAFLGLLGTTMEWAFDKHALYGSQDRARKGHLALVASAARHLVDRSEADLVRMALYDLQRVMPDAKRARLQHARVIKERQATFSLPLGTQAPETRTGCSQFFLAGDWTATGLPATVESAVRSGYRAAEAILRSLSQPA